MSDTYELRDGKLILSTTLQETYTKEELESLIAQLTSTINRNVNKSKNVLAKNLIPKKMRGVYQSLLSKMIELGQEVIETGTV